MVKRSDIPTFGSLRDIKLVNASSAVGGPVLSCLFAEQGADVIHIEGTKVPDMFRMFPWGWSTDRRNMRDLCMDIFSDEGKKAFFSLIEDADVLVESSRGGTWESKGITDEVLWAINPRLVILHISGFGLTGMPEMIQKASYDQVGQCYSGIAMLNADESGPVLIKPYPTDFYVALLGAWSVMAAIYRRNTTKVGESIDLSQAEAALRMHSYFAGEAFNTGVQTAPRKNSTESMSFFKTKDDDWVWVYATPGYTEISLRAIGLDENSGVNLKAPYVDGETEEYTNIIAPKCKEYCAAHSYEEIEKNLSPHYWLTAPVYGYKDILNDPHYKAREAVTEYEAPDLGKSDYKAIGLVPKFKNEPSQIWRGGPTMGMDNEDILAEAGMSAEEIQALYDKKLLVKR